MALVCGRLETALGATKGWLPATMQPAHCKFIPRMGSTNKTRLPLQMFAISYVSLLIAFFAEVITTAMFGFNHFLCTFLSFCEQNEIKHVRFVCIWGCSLSSGRRARVA